MLEGAAAHASAAAVDAYIEANSAKENAESIFKDTTDTYTAEDGVSEHWGYWVYHSYSGTGWDWDNPDKIPRA